MFLRLRATVSIDPTFSKAYRLLFSDEPDSAEQMRAMLDDALKQKYGTHKPLTSMLPKNVSQALRHGSFTF